MRLSSLSFGQVRVPACEAAIPPMAAAGTLSLGGSPTQSAAPPATRFNHAYWQRMAGYSEGAPSTATFVQSLRDPQVAHARVMETIASAKRIVAGAYLFVGADRYGVEYLEALVAAAKRGVTVVLTLSWLHQVASKNFIFETTAENRQRHSKALHELQEQGGSVVYQGTPGDELLALGAGNHWKATCADGERACMGGRNIADVHLNPESGMGDVDLYVEGAIAARLLGATINNAQQSQRMGLPNRTSAWLARGNLAVGEMIAQEAAGKHVSHLETVPEHFRKQMPTFVPVVFNPTKEPGENRVTQAIIDTINSCQRELLITGNYLNAGESTRQALIAAARRGVDVRVLGMSEADSVDAAPYAYASQRYVKYVREGIALYETHGAEHGKTLIADGKVAAVGGYNLSLAAEERLSEGMMFTDHADTVASVRRLALANMQRGCLVTPAFAEHSATRPWPIHTRIAALLTRKIA